MALLDRNASTFFFENIIKVIKIVSSHYEHVFRAVSARFRGLGRDLGVIMPSDSAISARLSGDDSDNKSLGGSQIQHDYWQSSVRVNI